MKIPTSPTFPFVGFFTTKAKLKSMFSPQGGKHDWEQLYDFKTQSYFYRNKHTDTFSRTTPYAAGDLTPISTLPLWIFKIEHDSEQKESYWEDLETGKVSFLRPETGTFVNEQHLSDFRKFNGQHKSARSSMYVSSSSRRPSQMVREEVHLLDTSHLKPVRVTDDYTIVNGIQQGLNFEELFEEANPDKFDAEARLQAAAAAINGTAPPSIAKQIKMRRLSTRDGGETPDFPVLDEHTIEMRSAFSTDNPMFNPKIEEKRSSRWRS